MTSHNNNGVSIISSDTQLAPFLPFGPKAVAFTVFHTSPTVPVSNNSSASIEPTSSVPRPMPGGTVFLISDFPPNGYSSPMHRTLSVDYCVVLEGSIWLQLDGGDETEVMRGEMVVVRGVNHLWMNRGETPARVLAVMVGSEPVKLENGTLLEETKIGARGQASN